MTSSGLLILCIVFITQLSVGSCVIKVEYTKTIVSDHKGDGFAWSLTTSNKKLVISAPWDNNYRGSLMVDDGMCIKAPQGETLDLLLT